MRIRKALTAVVVGGALIFSGSVLAAPAVAGAATGPAGTRACAAAEKRLPVLESRLTKLQSQLTAAQDALTRAQGAGKQAVVNRLDARVKNLQLGLDKVNGAIAKIHQTCD